MSLLVFINRLGGFGALLEHIVLQLDTMIPGIVTLKYVRLPRGISEKAGLAVKARWACLIGWVLCVFLGFVLNFF